MTEPDTQPLRLLGDAGRWHRTAHGPLYLRDEPGGQARFFPMRDWDDFVGVLVGVWAERVSALIQGEAQSHVRFMDGPFLVRLRALSGGRVAYELEDEERPRAAGGIAVLSELGRSVIELADSVDAEYRRQGWRRDNDWTTSMVEVVRLRVLLLGPGTERG